jgi:hypothetical protein
MARLGISYEPLRDYQARRQMCVSASGRWLPRGRVVGVPPLAFLLFFAFVRNIVFAVPEQQISCLSDPQLNAEFEVLNGGQIPQKDSCCMMDVCGLTCPEQTSPPDNGTFHLDSMNTRPTSMPRKTVVLFYGIGVISNSPRQRCPSTALLSSRQGMD